MASHSRFVIHNSFPRTVILNIEPEGVFVPLDSGEALSVIDVFEESPVTLTLGQSEQGDPIVSLWPGDGAIRVERDGVDVLCNLDSRSGRAVTFNTAKPDVAMLNRTDGHSEKTQGNQGARWEVVDNQLIPRPNESSPA